MPPLDRAAYQRAANRKWRAKDVEHARKLKRESRLRHLAASRAREHQYRVKNRQKLRDKRQAKYQHEMATSPERRQLFRDRQRRWQQNNPLKLRDWRLRKMYGISLMEYEQLLERQQGACAICRSTEPGKKSGVFSIDHDHATGQVRELLCAGCNTAIGHMREDPEFLRAAADYLERHATLKQVA